MKYAIYRRLPSWNKALHAKRRKGWARGAEQDFPTLHGQRLQDHVFVEQILRRRQGGIFWELGAGDGVTGLHSLNLELNFAWRGLLVATQPRPIPSRHLRANRRAALLDAAPASYPSAMRQADPAFASPDLVACHSVEWNEVTTTAALAGTLRPTILILHLPTPDPAWVKRLAPHYRLAFAYHDDEYYVSSAAS